MDHLIFQGNGIEIIERSGRVFIRYDAGEIVVHVQEHEITKQEAIKAQQGEKQAYEVILECQRRSPDL